METTDTTNARTSSDKIEQDLRQRYGDNITQTAKVIKTIWIK